METKPMLHLMRKEFSIHIYTLGQLDLFQHWLRKCHSIWWYNTLTLQTIFYYNLDQKTFLFENKLY